MTEKRPAPNPPARAQPERQDMRGKYCVIRTYSAGVHVGVVESHEGTEVRLTDARRIWSWKGANTLHEIALHGVGKGSRVSEPVPDILLTEGVVGPVLRGTECGQPQTCRQAVARRLHAARAQVIEPRLDQQHDRQRRAQPGQGGKAAAGQHTVEHLHEEQRHQQNLPDHRWCGLHRIARI